MIFLMAILSFGAGFMVNELFDIQFGRSSSNNIEESFSIIWEAWDHIGESYIGEFPTTQEITYGAAHGSIAVLGDPYTIFVEPVAREQERERLRGNFVGVGVELNQDEDGNFVLDPIADNPAEAAGVLAGDILIAVDGKSFTQETTMDEVAQMIRGEEGTTVILTVLHPGSDIPVDLQITRATILLPSVTYRILDQDETIGYIRISQFTGESGQEMENAILDLRQEGAQKLLLDLRQNGGGLRDAAVDVSGHFLDSGTVVYQINKDGEEQEFIASDGQLAQNMPLVVLVDNATASAAEIVAGALQDRDRAKLIGLPTFGKGSVQLVFDLSDGSSIHVTTAQWLTPDRNQINMIGLQPDVVVELEEDSIGSGSDPILDAAIEYLREG